MGGRGGCDSDLALQVFAVELCRLKLVSQLQSSAVAPPYLPPSPLLPPAPAASRCPSRPRFVPHARLCIVQAHVQDRPEACRLNRWGAGRQGRQRSIPCNVVGGFKGGQGWGRSWWAASKTDRQTVTDVSPSANLSVEKFLSHQFHLFEPPILCGVF